MRNQKLIPRGECAYLHPKGLGRQLGIRGKRAQGDISCIYYVVDPFDPCLPRLYNGNSNLLHTVRAVAMVSANYLSWQNLNTKGVYGFLGQFLTVVFYFNLLFISFTAQIITCNGFIHLLLVFHLPSGLG